MAETSSRVDRISLRRSMRIFYGISPSKPSIDTMVPKTRKLAESKVGGVAYFA